MCNCRQETLVKLKEMYPDAEYVEGQYETFSGRSYSDCGIKFPDKKKPRKILLLNTYCPICGKKYEDD